MEEDESIGEIYFTYLGPPPTDYLTNLAVKLLSNYLTSSATAPLQKEFVEIPKPLTTGIGFYTEDRVNKNEITGYASDVPAKHLETLGDAIKEKLSKIVKEEGIDMERMGLVIRRDKRKLLNSMESNVSGILADAVIGGALPRSSCNEANPSDFLYGDVNGKDLAVTFDDLEDYAILEKWSAQDWSSLLDKSVQVKNTPESAHLAGTLFLRLQSIWSASPRLPLQPRSRRMRKSASPSEKRSSEKKI